MSIATTFGQLNLTKEDDECGKLATVFSQTKLTGLAAVDV